MNDTTDRTADDLKVWVGDLAAYNAGRLVGEWVSITDADALAEAYRKASHDGTSDYFVADTDGPRWFADVVSESTTEEALNELAEALADVDDLDAFGAYVANDPYTLRHDGAAAMVEEFADRYCGDWPSMADYAEELFSDTAPSREVVEQMNNWPFSCIDWERAARELTIGGDYWTATAAADPGRVYVFRAY